MKLAGFEVVKNTNTMLTLETGYRFNDMILDEVDAHVAGRGLYVHSYHGHDSKGQSVMIPNMAKTITFKLERMKNEI